MSAEANKKLIHEVIDVIFNQQQLDRVEDYFAGTDKLTEVL